ncbi:linear amide C-N hydrolase [Pontibaca salina]|uniref:Linear amide C-N hydrolase n=1 Tax=Pontibaca salina TaxID=2795731 RepID=A0A934HSU0_9RHOB|nr:linear amide C-N hydrolase [Pontibaca salina]MBI6630065.1 linear amide C-N hydrolase [Pontibaca salina]
MKTRPRTYRRVLQTAACALMAVTLAPLQHAKACTRLVYETGAGNFITARGMDWNDPTARTAIWVYPRGMEQNGGAGDNPITWTSKYGSVFASFYDAANADGMNEAGLVANVLYLAESDFGDAAETGKPTLSVGAWNQYFLDNFATVAEAVVAMEDDPFTVVAPTLPNGQAAAVHLSISDAGGDSAIFEYIDGALKIHHSRDHKVMTNSPVFDEQLGLVNYWRTIGGNRFLPGTINAADRFVRTDYLLSSTPKYEDDDLATAAAFSLIRAIGVPVGMKDPDHPNISMTLWRTVADQENKTWYFESVIDPSVLWVDLDGIDFSEGSGTRTIPLGRDTRLAGEVSAEFEPAEPIAWMSGN